MKRLIVVAAAFAALGCFGTAAAQAPLPLALQVGGGANIPVGDFADVASSGFGFSVGSGFQIVPNLALYAGFSWSRFGSEAAELGDLTDIGLSTGLTLVFPQLGPTVFPWVGGGLALHHLSVADAAEDPGWGNPGFGLGGGLLVPITANVRFSPSVGYVHYRNSFPGRVDDITVSYLSVGMAFNISP